MSSSGATYRCPSPTPARSRIRIEAAGVSPTDLKIRRGDLQTVFPLLPDAVLGFEAAGVVDALGPSASGVKEGDEVVSLLAALGGYAEYTLAFSWTSKPPNVSWRDAAALPASAEAAVGILKQLGVSQGETPLILAPSVGREDDRHTARRLPGRHHHRRRSAARPRPFTRPGSCPGHLRR
jgi:NADPH:quinone reductase-like Zn-dependent oxidoreductase